MTQNENDLLLKDICARLPYGVWIESKLKSCKFGAKCMLHAHDIDAIERGQYDFYKPYLFPLSSMTEEQKEELNDIFDLDVEVAITHIKNGTPNLLSGLNRLNWFIKNHFDIYGLIPMGLANDATGLNIY